MFCKNCGSQLKPESKFCSNCGYNIQVMAEEEEKKKQEIQHQQDIANGLKPLYVMLTSEKAGFIKTKLCYMSFYNDRLILGYMNNQRLKQEMEQMAIKENVKHMNWLERTAYGMTFYENYKEVYYSKSPEVILNEQPDNREIYYVSVISVKFIPKSHLNRENDSHSKFGELIFKTSHGKYKYTHTYEDSDRQIRNFLQSIFPGKI